MILLSHFTSLHTIRLLYTIHHRYLVRRMQSEFEGNFVTKFCIRLSKTLQKVIKCTKQLMDKIVIAEHVLLFGTRNSRIVDEEVKVNEKLRR